jgi:hypothetical protein
MLNELKVDTNIAIEESIEEVGASTTTFLINTIIRLLGDRLLYDLTLHEMAYTYDEIKKLQYVTKQQFKRALEASRMLRIVYGECVYIRGVDLYSCNIGIPMKG